MLPNFPKLKAKMLKFWNQYAEHRMNTNLGFLNQATRYRHHEGDRWAIRREDGSVTESVYEDATSGFSIHDSEVPSLTHNKIKIMVDQAMLRMADQIEEHVLQNLLSDLKDNDRLISSSETEVSIDLILQGLESILISFDDDGNADMPSIIVSPEMGQKLKDRIEEWNNDPEINHRFDALKARKREQWRDRENSRKLVD